MGRKVVENVVAKFVKGFRKEFLAVRKTGKIKELMDCSYGKIVVENNGKKCFYEIYANGESDGFRVTITCKKSTEEVLDMFLDALKSMDWNVREDTVEMLQELER